MNYRTGQEIKRGDRVLFHRNPAEIEFVVTNSDNPENAWNFQEFGGGVMVREPGDPNTTFVSADQIPDCEDLEFLARAQSE